MIKQAIKYGIVGVANTILSLVIIWIMTKKFGCAEAISNFTGYVIGLINSFFLNRKWTFNSTINIVGSAVRFFLVFAVCYLLQLGVLLYLNRYYPHNPPLYLFFEPILRVLKIDALFYIQILSMIVYTVVNFLINKYYTFKK
ncbi:MAG: GtrA family protein [Tannerella sp.]|jgi:putative flippase GtrA|nr:GtrA family protein [Tannerella sp.]